MHPSFHTVRIRDGSRCVRGIRLDPLATPDNLATFNGNVVWDALAPPPVNDVLSLPTEPQMIEVPGHSTSGI